MRPYVFTIIFLFFLDINMMSQVTISGTIVDHDSEPIIGANIYLEDTYDGGISDAEGRFSFTSSEEGNQTLVFSYLGFETQKIRGSVDQFTNLEITLEESIHTLDAVVISASTFKAGDNSAAAALKPMDILTTAGSIGDVIGALQTLPGTQANPEDGRLFIRGGEARETNIYIDGLRVFAPFTRTISGTPARGRYSPLLFKGVSFSTGGYSSAYGQALSGILEMNTIDDIGSTETNISLMSVGLGLAHSQKYNKHSFTVSTSYVNLSPYNWLYPDRIKWQKPYSGFSGEGVYRYKTDKGLLKSYIAGDANTMEIFNNNLDTGQDELISIQNNNLYSNTSYSGVLNETSSIRVGVSLGMNADQFTLNQTYHKDQNLNGLHARVDLKSIINQKFILNYGLDYLKRVDEIIYDSDQKYNYDRNMSGTFVEADYFFSKNLAVKIGLRGEHNFALGQTSLDPRITIAQKLSGHSQISAAYGRFTQEISSDILMFHQNLLPEKAQHYLINYNYKSPSQMIRLEAYYKAYNQLIKFERENEAILQADNTGSGRAYGIDLFWRQNNVIRNVDFWVAYSWLDHQRNYQDFPEAATPSFSTAHNVSVVSKIWMENLRSQLGVTYNMASGRPFENPNTPGFLNERSQNFHSLNVSWAYLVSPQEIFFVSVSNATGFNNEFGYRYSSNPDPSGIYPGEIIRPNADQFFFVGFFKTLSADKDKNQLETL